jgi:hypothetical protein
MIVRRKQGQAGLLTNNWKPGEGTLTCPRPAD